MLLAGVECSAAIGGRKNSTYNSQHLIGQLEFPPHIVRHVCWYPHLRCPPQPRVLARARTIQARAIPQGESPFFFFNIF